MLIQKTTLNRPMTYIEGMTRQPGDSGILILKQDDIGARHYQLADTYGNVGNILADNYLPRSTIALRWYRDDEFCHWSIDKVTKGIYPTTIPVFRVDDYNNILEVFHPLPNSEILISTNGGPWVPYSGSITVGAIDRPEGYWRAFVPGNETRTESPVAHSLPFHATPIGFDYTLNFNLS